MNICSQYSRYLRQVVAIGCLLASTTAVSAQIVDKAKLIKAVRLPVIGPDLATPFSTGDIITGTRFQVGDEISMMSVDAMRKAMKGDASDAPLYYRIACITGSLRKEAESKEAAKKALELYLERAKGAPKDVRLQAELGLAYAKVGRDEEALRTVQAAIALEPNSADCWLALAYVSPGSLKLTEYQELEQTITELGSGRLNPMQFLAKVTPTFLQRLETVALDKIALYDKAVSLAPKSIQCYLQRVCHRMLSQSAILNLKGLAQQKEQDRRLLYGDVFTNDFLSALSYGPTDYRDATFILFSLFRSAVFNLGSLGLDPRTTTRKQEGMAIYKKLPQTTLQNLRQTVDILEKLRNDPSAEVSFGSLGALSTYYTMIGDYENALRSIKIMARRFPDRDLAWLAGCSLLGEENRSAELTTWCEEFAAARKTVISQIALAHAYEVTGKPDKVEITLKDAAAKNPTDYFVRLSQAAILLKSANDAASLKQAGVILDAIAEIAPKDTPAGGEVNYYFLHGIFLGLTGKVADARDELQEVLARDPSNMAAWQALDALGKP